jgi:hypothetical protein
VLNWTTTEMYIAVDPNNVEYRIWLDRTPGRPAEYVAVRSFTDEKGRFYEAVVARRPTLVAAKSACEDDAKS